MDDDIIVVEGTPLADHLRSLGLEAEIESQSTEEEIKHEKVQPWWKRIWEGVTDMLLPSKISFTRETFQKVSVDLILQSRVFEEEEIMPILVHRDFDFCVTGDNLPWYLMRRALLEVSVVMIPALAAGFWRKRSVVSVLIVASPALALICSWIPIVRAAQDYNTLLKYLNSVIIVRDKLRMASRVINETMLVSQGYLLSERNAAAAWKLETKSLIAVSHLSEKSLPGLRIALIEAASRLAREYSKELQTLRKMKPLPHHLDHPSLSLPPVEDTIMPPIIGDNHDFIPELRDIKKTMDIAMLKEQEYIKRLLFKMLAEDKDSYSVQIGPKLMNTISDSIMELEMALILNKCLFSRSLDYRPKAASKPIEHSEGAIYSLCHSLTLHLLQSCRVAQSIEDSLESNDMSQWRREVTLNYLLNKINFHLESAKECQLRATILVNRSAYSKCDSSDAVTERSKQDHTFGVSSSEESVMPRDRSPSDQIFEVIGEMASSEGEDDDVCARGLKDKTDQENSRMMMRELRTVLRVKARDWEEREKKLRGYIPSAREEMSPEMDSDDDVKLSSQTTVEGGHSSLTSSFRMLPSEAESENVASSVAGVPRGSALLGPNLLGSLATQAVAVAKLNQGFGLMCGEEDFVVSGDED